MKTAPLKTVSSKIVSSKTVSWKFPLPGMVFLRIELMFMLFIAFLLFLGSYFYFRQVGLPLVLAGFFLLLSLAVMLVIRRIHQVEEHYEAKEGHLHITRNTRNTSRTEKVPLKQITQHKLDPFFLGGYLATKKSRHPLFFNAKEEVIQFEKFLKGALAR